MIERGYNRPLVTSATCPLWLGIAGKILLLMLVSLTTIGGFIWLPAARGFRNPELARIVVFHVPCSLVGYIATAVATWFAIKYLWKRDPADDCKSRVSFALGLVLWALTTITGAIFANAQWGMYWSWDIKQACILMLLLIFIGYFALRAAIDNTHKSAVVGASYAIFALLAVPYLTYVLPNSTPDTLHPKGTLTGGLSLEYSIELYGGFFGLLAVYIWAFRLHVAAAMVELRIRKLGLVPVVSHTISHVSRQEG